MSMSNITSIETEPIEMESDPTPQRVLGDEPGPGKDGETNGEGLDDAENKRNKENKENEAVKSSIGRRKGGRPADKDKEGISVNKKAKCSPKTLKIKTYHNINGKSNGFSELYVKSVTEKCIFCHDEHLRETFWQGTGKNGPESLKIPICKNCHTRLQDVNVINEIREAIERGGSKMNGGEGGVKK